MNPLHQLSYNHRYCTLGNDSSNSDVRGLIVFDYKSFLNGEGEDQRKNR